VPRRHPTTPNRPPSQRPMDSPRPPRPSFTNGGWQSPVIAPHFHPDDPLCFPIACVAEAVESQSKKSLVFSHIRNSDAKRPTHTLLWGAFSSILTRSPGPPPGAPEGSPPPSPQRPSPRPSPPPSTRRPSTRRPRPPCNPIGPPPSAWPGCLRKSIPLFRSKHLWMGCSPRS